MKTVLIIYPHWVPCNLAGVQRPRLIGNYLKQFGWSPLLLTVDSKYYEEPLDLDISKTVSKDIEVIYTKAYRLTKPRIVGDIGLRAFPFLMQKALELCKARSIDMIWIPIPSFYTALLGRLLHEKTGIPYGIDYIDPWIMDTTNHNNLRNRLSQVLARLLEPIAIKKAALITGVSTPYYWPALQRNFKKFPIHAGMPYGFDPHDHQIIIKILKMPWDTIPNVKPWLYAGAFLPNSHLFMDCFFQAIAALKSENRWDENIRLFFIGTGPYPAKRIVAYAADHGLSDIVVEQRERQPFLTILNLLSAADRILLFGSTEKHYTASKTFQCLLSKRPLFAILHAESSAVEVIESVSADGFLVKYLENNSKNEIISRIKTVLEKFQHNQKFAPDLSLLKLFSSEESARVLAGAMDMVMENRVKELQ